MRDEIFSSKRGRMSATFGIRVGIAPVTLADAYAGAADALLQGIAPLAAALPGTAWPLTFLAGQVLGCALKGFLAKRGVKESRLKHKDIRHHLLGLWSEAVSRGFQPTINPAWLERLSELHDGAYVVRYPMGLNGVVLPQCTEMAMEVPEIVIALRTARAE
jgi:hypothetical protein